MRSEVHLLAISSSDGTVYVFKMEPNGISKIGMAQLAFAGNPKNPKSRLADIAVVVEGQKPMLCLFEKSGRFKVLEILI